MTFVSDRARRRGVALVVATALVMVTAVTAVEASPPQTGVADRCADTDTWSAPAPAEWMGAAHSEAVRFPSRTGACLAAVVYGPDDVPKRKLAAVVIVPGTGGGGDTQWWAAHDLAASGYVAVIVAPQGQGGSDVLGDPAPCQPGVDPSARLGQQCPGLPPAANIDNYADAITAGIDWLVGGGSRYGIHDHKIGAAGFSQGARGATLSQMKDERVRAVVAWDNLTSDTSGDDGAPSGGGAQGALIAGQLPTSSYMITPRAPAMGQASDGGNGEADVKKTAYEHWRAAGTPAMQVVFEDSAHGDWSVRDTPSGELSEGLRIKSLFTRGWFDLHLRGDAATLERAVGPSWSSARSVIDAKFHSAISLPSIGLDCGDLFTCAAPVAFGGAAS